MSDQKRTAGELEEILRLAVPELFSDEGVEHAFSDGWNSAALSLRILELIAQGKSPPELISKAPMTEDQLINAFVVADGSGPGWQRVCEQIAHLVKDELIRVVDRGLKSPAYLLTSAGIEVLEGK